MVYSFQKRKELNEALMAKYPNLEVDYKRDGVPFVHVDQLPLFVDKIDSIFTLRDRIPETPYPWKTVLPVLYRIKKLSESGEFIDLYEISYVNCTEKSLDLAENKIDRGNLWAFPDLIRL